MYLDKTSGKLWIEVSGEEDEEPPTSNNGRSLAWAPLIMSGIFIPLAGVIVSHILYY